MIESKIVNFCFIFIALQLGYIFSFGNFSLPGIFILIVTLALLILLFANQKLKLLEISHQNVIYITLIVSTVLTFLNLTPTILQPGILERPESFAIMYNLIRYLIGICLALQIFRFFYKFKFFFTLQIVLIALVHFLIIAVSPNPRIDTYDIVKIGSEAVLQFKNPYRISYPPLYKDVTPDYFSYTPGILYLTAPFSLTKIDHRYLFAALEIAAAVTVYLVATRRKKVDATSAQLISLIFLFNPSSLFIVLRGWSDTVVLFLLALVFLSFQRNWPKVAPIIILGYILSLKQTLIFLPLFFLKYLKSKKVFLAFTVFALLSTPFLLWSPVDFIKDTVIFHNQNAIRHDALMINNLFYFYTHSDLPSILLILVWATSFVILIYKQKKGANNILDTLSLWYLIFFLFNNKQSFVNYYYFIGGLLILQIAYLLGEIAKNRSKRKQI